MDQKGSIGVIILIIILFAAGIGGSYYLGGAKNKSQVQQVNIPTSSSTPTPTSGLTADWLIYSDQTISFKYPPSWKLTNNKREPFTATFGIFPTPSDSQTVVVSNPATPQEIGFDKHVSFAVFPYPNMTPSQIVDTIQQSKLGAMASVFARKTMVVGGLSAQLYKWGGQDNVNWYALLYKGTAMVEIDLSTQDDIAKDTTENQILSTFKFSQ